MFEASVASCWLDVPAPWDRIIFGADGEDLAEEFVEEWLACMAPALEHYGLPLSLRTVDSRRGGGPRDYTLMINGIRCSVWKAAEWDHDAEPPWDPWLVATLRPLATVNTLLASAGSPVRAHVLAAGGNEGIVVLIDPKVVAAMRDSGRYAASAIPEVVAAEQ